MLSAATVAWRCPSPGHGAGCNPQLERMEAGPPVYDPVRWSCQFCTADSLIVFAFDLATSAQVKGEPNWTFHDVYRAEVAPTSPATRPQMLGLLRQAVIRAFALHYHIDDLPAPVWRLTVGPSGPKFKPTTTAVSQNRERLMGGNYDFGSLRDLVRWLNVVYYNGGALSHPIEDGTGLKGNYDIELSLGPGVFPAEAPLLALIKQQLGLIPILVKGHSRNIVVDSIQHLQGKWTYP